MSAASAMRVVFAGTPDFAAVALRAVASAGHEVVGVLTQPDRPAGRGMKLQASAVKLVAQGLGAPVWQPRSLRLDGKFAADAQEAQAQLLAVHADVMVVAAYGLILPQWVLGLPRLGCLNIHGSLLPRWRGAAPIHRAIEAGDALTGITIMQMDAGLDTGDMLLTQPEPIGPEDTTALLHDRLAALGASLVVRALEQAQQGLLQHQPQPAEGVTYAYKIDKAEAAIDWSASAQVIERRLRAFDPFPGATFELQGHTVKLWRARVVPGQGSPGQVLQADAQRCVVACGEGALELLELQRPGARRVPVAAFMQGSPAPQLGSHLAANPAAANAGH